MFLMENIKCLTSSTIICKFPPTHDKNTKEPQSSIPKYYYGSDVNIGNQGNKLYFIKIRNEQIIKKVLPKCSIETIFYFCRTSPNVSTTIIWKER